MLQLILHLSKLFFREPCSVQREILNRLQKKKAMGCRKLTRDKDLSDACEHHYKKAPHNGLRNNYTKGVSQDKVFNCLNFLSGQKVPINDLAESERNSLNLILEAPIKRLYFCLRLLTPKQQTSTLYCS